MPRPPSLQLQQEEEPRLSSEQGIYKTQYKGWEAKNEEIFLQHIEQKKVEIGDRKIRGYNKEVPPPNNRSSRKREQKAERKMEISLLT